MTVVTVVLDSEGDRVPMMFPDVKSVRYLRDHLLELTFADGTSGIVDFDPWIIGKGGVFTMLEDKAYFARVSVNDDIGTIVWPNGADFDPDVLYSHLTGKQLLLDEDQLMKR
jgi:hypothetical protein